jgi:hypothetical protein
MNALLLALVLTASPADQRAAVEQAARDYCARLLQGDARGAVSRSALPFFLEDDEVKSAEVLFEEWLTRLRAQPLERIRLRGLEVLTPAEMQAKHGPPPPHLAKLPWRRPNTYLAVANLSGRAAVLVFRLEKDGWKAVAFHD